MLIHGFFTPQHSEVIADIAGDMIFVLGGVSEEKVKMTSYFITTYFCVFLFAAEFFSTGLLGCIFGLG